MNTSVFTHLLNVVLFWTLSNTILFAQESVSTKASPWSNVVKDSTELIVYNVKEFGARGDGRHIDSDAVNRAIEVASEHGGGIVFFPAGEYACYSIRLKSHITLYLSNGAVIKAAVPTEERGYDLPEENEFTEYQDFGHSHWQNSLIWGIGLHNVTIEGDGLIDGTEGLGRWGRRNSKVAEGNKAIALKNCRNVTIRDISLLRCGHFALLLTGVDNLTLNNLKVDTNRDAFDIDCCANVRVSDCTVNTLNDDAIVLKSSYALGYAKPCENVTITGCQVSGYDIGTLLDGTFAHNVEKAPDQDGPTGRIKFGTESNGGFKNITISNCVFDRCRGLALETVDGGTIEDITVTGIVMRNIQNSPIYIRLGNRARGPKETTPVAKVRRINISNVIVKDADCRYASIIAGIPGHPIEDVSLENIYIQYRGGLSMVHASEQPDSLINNFFTRKDPIISRKPYDIPERIADYPEPSTMGILPCYGLFIRHAKNLTLRNIRLETIEEDGRPAVVLMDVDGIEFNQMKVSKTPDVPCLVLKEVSRFQADNFNDIKSTKINRAKNKEL